MKRIILIVITTAILAGGIFGYSKYRAYFGKNVPSNLSTTYLEIPTGSSYADVQDLLFKGGFLLDAVSFEETAKRMQFDTRAMRAGRFEIRPGWSNVKLIRHLRSGEQVPVKVILNNERLLEDVAGKVAQFIEPDSAELLATFLDPEQLSESGFSRETLMSLFIPNTYEFFWNTTPEKFIARMQREHDNFWEKKNRLKKAEKLGLSPEEVYTLASIVEKETNQDSEKARMAGVYYNRLQIPMLLQADPTCVFATRDFMTKRVTNYHLEFDSPYNTYKYLGLPPGPIAMAAIPTIEAVLNLEDHNYLYFCAKGDGSGLHSFAKDLNGHNRNVAVYQRNLRERGLR